MSGTVFNFYQNSTNPCDLNYQKNVMDILDQCTQGGKFFLNNKNLDVIISSDNVLVNCQDFILGLAEYFNKCIKPEIASSKNIQNSKIHDLMKYNSYVATVTAIVSLLPLIYRNFSQKKAPIISEPTLAMLVVNCISLLLNSAGDFIIKGGFVSETNVQFIFYSLTAITIQRFVLCAQQGYYNREYYKRVFSWWFSKDTKEVFEIKEIMTELGKIIDLYEKKQNQGKDVSTLKRQNSEIHRKKDKSKKSKANKNCQKSLQTSKTIQDEKIDIKIKRFEEFMEYLDFYSKISDKIKDIQNELNEKSSYESENLTDRIKNTIFCKKKPDLKYKNHEEILDSYNSFFIILQTYFKIIKSSNNKDNSWEEISKNIDEFNNLLNSINKIYQDNKINDESTPLNEVSQDDKKDDISEVNDNKNQDIINNNKINEDIKKNNKNNFLFSELKEIKKFLENNIKQCNV